MNYKNFKNHMNGVINILHELKSISLVKLVAILQNEHRPHLICPCDAHVINDVTNITIKYVKVKVTDTKAWSSLC